jgi:8-oxo-dGTP pyrophosphatase MutT (NUDIX family)
MGAGILPTCIYKNKLYFLFGKENKYADTPGFAEFGGGNDNNESHFETAVREGTEELTGFLGSEEELRKMLKKHGTYNIDWKGSYRTHIFPIQYDPYLPHYYNNNQRFLQRKLPEKLIKDSKIFEKAEIKWFCIDDLMKQKKEFRSYYQNIVDMIYAQREEIYLFIKKANLHKKTRRRLNKYNKTLKAKKL